MKEKDNNQEDFSLYTEKIVVKPSVKYKRLIRAVKLIVAALIFGVVASGTMVFVYPWLDAKINTQAQQREPLEIEKDEYPTTEPGEEYTVEEDTESNNNPGTYSEKAQAGTLKAVVQNAQKSIVTIDSYRASVDEVLAKEQSPTETVGLVIGEANSEYIILTNYAAIVSSSSIVVKFNAATEVNAVLLGYEEQTGLALLGVKQTDIPANEQDDILVATLDNSYKMKQGDRVVAAGKIYGQIKTVDYGMVTNVSSMSGMDNTYQVINTNFMVYPGDYGYLYNMSGNVVGICIPALSNSVEGNLENSSDEDITLAGGAAGMFRAAGISDLKCMIERLSSSEALPYMGIKGQNVTNSIALAYGLPMGIYIMDISMDSPAFAAGLQQGDVIVGFEGNMVLTIQAFSEKLYQCSNGQNVTLTVKRPGKDNYRELSFSVTLSSR